MHATYLAYSEMPSNAPVAYLQQNARRGWELVVHNAHNYHTGREEGLNMWQTRTAEEASRPAGLAGVPFERTGFYQLRKQDMPITILIPQWGHAPNRRLRYRTQTAILQFKRVVDTKLERAPPKSAPRRSAAPAEEKGGAYITRQGDTLARIAGLNRVSIEALHKANPGVDWRRLQVGQKLIVPKTL